MLVFSIYIGFTIGYFLRRVIKILLLIFGGFFTIYFSFSLEKYIKVLFKLLDILEKFIWRFIKIYERYITN